MDMSLPEPRETRLRRLKMRSMRRGMREMDLILTAFAASELDGMSDADLDRYDQLLEEYDPDLYRWIAGQQPPRFVLLDFGQTVQLGRPLFRLFLQRISILLLDLGEDGSRPAVLLRFEQRLHDAIEQPAEKLRQC